MNETLRVVYSLAPGVDALPLGNGDILLRSDTVTIRLEGRSATLLFERVLPLLGSPRTLDEILAALPDVAADALLPHLDALVDATVLRRTATGAGSGAGDANEPLAPTLAMLELLGVAPEEARGALSRSRVGVVGLEGPGAHLATQLAACGVGELILVDPFLCHPADVALMPPLGAGAVGTPRQQAVQAAVESLATGTAVRTMAESDLTREGVAAVAADCDLLVSCFDRGFCAAHHWVNRASLARGVPAIYAQAKANLALAGPFVLPGQTACYMCYRMRAIATEDDFAAAMTYEEFLDRQRQPRLHARAVLPMIPPYLASVAASECLKLLLGLGSPDLAGKVMSFDALTLRSEAHPILQRPDCPVCGTGNQPRRQPAWPDMRQDEQSPGDLRESGPRLVSRLTGVVRAFEPVQKDVGEPVWPVVFRAELANHRFLVDDDRQHRVCSGKGMTVEDARSSALGEAVERYSAGCWEFDEIVYARRRDLDACTLDPRQLVLFAPHQYAELPYAPYDDDTVLGWIPAKSLVSGHDVYVPALAVFMNYAVQRPEEFLFPVTSNGLAAGPTLIDAVLRAGCEVLERDAFLASWLHRLPCRRADPPSHPDADVVRLCAAYHRRGVEILLFRLPTDHPCAVFAALALQRPGTDGPAVVVGLGADLAPARAARKAVMETAQVRPGLRRRLRRPEVQERMRALVCGAQRVETLDDHDLLYASHEVIGAFDFLLQQPAEPTDWEPAPASSADEMDRLLDWLAAEQLDLLYVNLTPPDMERLHLHTVRAILPSFQPMHFGWNEARLGGDRLPAMPDRLGLAPIGLGPGQLNPAPHPLA